MSSTIPPLLCSTPPPIDFDDGGGTNENDDFEPFESTEDGAYDKFDAPSEANPLPTNDHCQSNANRLPVPECPSITTCIGHEINPSIQKDKSQEETDEKNTLPDIYLPKLSLENSNPTATQDEHRKSISNKDPIELIISEPPPIDVGYSSESQSPKNSRGDSPLSIEFSPGNLSDDDGSIDFQINESRYDDNTSLPSLKFDAINLSKSTTPTLEEKTTIAHKSVGIDETQPSTTKENEKISAFELNSVDEKAALNIESTCNQEPSLEAGKWSEGASSVDCVEVKTTPAYYTVDLTQKSRSALAEDKNEQNDYVLQDLREDLEDDFVSGEASPPPENILRRESNDFQPFENYGSNEGTEVESVFPTSNQLSADTANEEVLFEADFSQAIFSSEQTIKSTSIVINETGEKLPGGHNSRVDDLDDDFEEFQDFTTADSAAPGQANAEFEANRVSEEDKPAQDNDIDDDFGDFNDFQGGGNHTNTETDVETNETVNLTKIDDKLRSVLEIMFPVDFKSDDTTQAGDSNAPKLSNNDLATNLREIDSAKALEYQWSQSSMKTSLVRALGIDSRNILYGEKWNSSMPKFAANLGFNPLEPLKPTKLSQAASISQQSKSSSSGFVEKTTTASSTADVPAVKFDWLSSGLVNPLDESHAHTLLLDLDQLVVVANLDKIKLDSSSCSSSTSLMRTTTSSTAIGHSSDGLSTATNYLTTHTVPPKPYRMTTVCYDSKYNKNTCLDDKYHGGWFINDEHNTDGGGTLNAWINQNLNYVTNVEMDNMKTSQYSTSAMNHINLINATNCFTTNIANFGFVNNSHNDMFDQYLDCRVKEILHERKTETIHPTQLDDSNGSSGATPNDEDTTTTNEQTSIDYVTSLSGFNNDLNAGQDTKETTVSAEPTSITSRGYGPGENYIESPSILPTNAKLIPLKETHIYTPSKTEGTISRSVHKSIENDPIDFDYEIAAAGIVINEQVVKKEYRDIVYDPNSKVDGTTDTMSSELSPSSKVDTEQHIAVVDPNKNFRQKLKGPDILSGPILSILEKKTDSASRQSFDLVDDFSEFQQSVPVFQKEQKSSFSMTNDALSNLHIKSDNFSLSSSCVRGTTKENDSFDDDFTDFQSVLPTASTKIDQTNYIPDVGSSSRTQTPSLNEEMILSPAVLLPQAIQLQNSEPKINWPSDSDINPEELARLESLFPQAKKMVSQPEPSANPNIPAKNTSPKKESREDDDWSDFVSVPPTMNSDNLMQKAPSMQPVSKVNTISKPYDDDDWSDFVSSVPASAQTSAQQKGTRQQWSAPQLPPPQFSSWNQPSVYNILPPMGSTVPSFASTNIPNATQHLTNRTVPTIPAANLYQANNYNNHYLLNGHLAQRGASQLQQNHLQYRTSQQMRTNEQLSQHQRNTSNLHANANILKSQLNMAPSISLLPDLSFAAPKSLVNLTRTNTSSKK